ncbi:initiator protein NS1 [Trichonephila inaurata madagascariensis]|uniref:Initiator protein NS1 n=1 Tax=Trichonephila inaurata madagascariensis TaxID=2747483 RepID=A0A8X6MGS0_9ARAC|nr:initiator protein NS1 [Trichonephila inaurata madagascariensis]
MYFSRNFLETICDHSIVGCDNLETVVERFENLPELEYENVLYYWMENCHKKWKSILDGPYLSMMRQPDDYDPEETWNHRNDPMCHSIRCRACTLEDLQQETNNGRGEEHFYERCIGKHDNHDGTRDPIQPETMGGLDGISEQPLEDQASSYLRLRAIKNIDPDLYNSVKAELFDLFREPLGILLSTPFGATRRYVSDVLVLGNGEERRNILQWLEGNGLDFPGQLYGFVEEETHIHIIHDCAYSNRSCRCRWRNHPGVRNAIKKPLRRPKYIRQFDWIDWIYIILYFYLSKRGGQKKIWINGRVRRLPGGFENLRWEALCKRTQDVLEGQRERVFDNSESEEPIDGRRKQIVSECVRGPAKKGGRFEELCKLTQLLLTKYLCIPLTDVRKIILPSNVDHNLKLHVVNFPQAKRLRV